MTALLGVGPVPWLLVAWALVMISVPLLAPLGSRWKAWGISAGVLAQVLVVTGILAVSWSPRGVFVALVVVPVLGWLAEFVGSRTGIPFGRYHYTSLLQPQIHRVPIAIPLAWLMMLPPSWGVAQLLIPDAALWLRAVVAGYAFMAWDIYLDPHLTRWEFWRWEQKGVYEGVPLINFLGWWLWATVISAVVFWLAPWAELVAGPLLLIYGLTWLFQAGGHFVFWRWPVSGAAGFLAMGLVAIPAIARFLGAG